MQIGISPVELQRMTRLTIRVETDSLIKTAVRERLVAVGTIQLLTVHRRDISREMSLMIKSENVRIARVDTVDLKLRMFSGKRIERLGKSLRRTGQIESDLLRLMRMSILRGEMEIHSFLRRSGHHLRLVVAGRALRARDYAQRGDPAVFLVTGGARTILDHVRLMKCVQLVARLAFAIDRREWDAFVKA